MKTFDVFDARDLIALPGGDNDTDTVFEGVHFNVTTLNHWNYTHYSNGTLSNGSNCWLTFAPYQPKLLLNNGTFVNATRCWSAIDPIGLRGYIGIGFAAAYGIALVLTLTALTKHGRLYLPKETRFYPIGRRWQWYWACFTCACALISLFTNIDVDRYYVQELPIIIHVFFWYLVCMGTLALVWESVRHWNSWLERQFIDPNPFIYRDDDRRASIEFWLPLWFYFWVWMNFFLVVPRSWNFAKLQRSPDQTRDIAIPSATSTRFKAGAFCLVVAWLTIFYSIRHSINHYKPRNRGIYNRAVGLVRAVPPRFMLTLPLALCLIAYQILMSFDWNVSLIRVGAVLPIMYAWGYGPSLLIILIQIVYGFVSPNEDKALIRQRRERGDAINRELGLVKKPAWWRRVRGDHLYSLRDKIMRNVHEVGERGVGRRIEGEAERQIRLENEALALENHDDVELANIARQTSDSDGCIDRPAAKMGQASYTGKSNSRHAERLVQTAATVLFPADADAETQRQQRVAYLMTDGPPPPPYSDGSPANSPTDQDANANVAHRTNSSSTTNSATSPPQQVRSMLDI
ncbi:hypothetical protein CDD81_4763 [Ophiocordyceps australis]|uniref:Uncharacterized protein n=1 Tax=Ophiocordyceps australis TaxID=1399860 RepID=A0A2C5XAB4_9HYPO|nr:hypothetical protein CDD81_4763 [Ophiocordyceps australis]